MKKSKLSKTHKRILTSLLFVLEQKTEHIEHMINQPAENASYSIDQDLSEENKIRIQKSCTALKESLNHLAEEFNLSKRQISQAHYIKTMQSQMWEHISDAFSNKLKGYGQQTVVDAKQIDPSISKLSAIIEELKPV